VQLGARMRRPWIIISVGSVVPLRHLLEAASANAPQRILVVAPAHLATTITDQLADFADVELVCEPRDLGSAPRMLLPIARVLDREPLGSVVLVPGDNHAIAPHMLCDAIRVVSKATSNDPITMAGTIGSPLQFVASGLVTRFWDETRRHLPTHARILERYVTAIGTPAEALALRGAYAQLEPASVTRDLLARVHPLTMIPLESQVPITWGP
jgi:mannose-1-phosphate guanylyltransferase